MQIYFLEHEDLEFIRNFFWIPRSSCGMTLLVNKIIFKINKLVFEVKFWKNLFHPNNHAKPQKNRG